MKTINRVGGIDLVKCIAILFVISVHFFFNNGFYTEPMQGAKMFIATFLRWLFYTCVPLFILTTGYLMRNKELNKKYYKPLPKIIITYLIISVVTLILRRYYFQDGLTWREGIKGLFFFNTNEYAWYVNMYIGLFLLIPFLNVLYNNLQTQNGKLILILSLVLLSGVPILMPNYWKIIYPLTYYFIGAYINEYPIKTGKSYVVLLAFAVLLTETMISFFASIIKNVPFIWYGDYGILSNVILSTCFFVALYDIKIQNAILNFILIPISKLTLEIYLISYLIDRLVYPQIKQFFSSSTEMLPYYVVIVPFIFLISVLLAIILNFTQKKIFTYRRKKDK